ncbi:MAG: ABC transporter permease [Phycisphaerae bacterium]|nr:ABC transporter permease [Phycisphaerae bacterium]
MNDWTIILRSLRARLFSTVTTAALVAIAVALMLVLLMMRDAAQQAFRRGGGDMHLLVSNDQSSMVSFLNGVLYANPPRAPIAWARAQQLRQSLPLGDNGYAIPTQLGDSFMGQPVMATEPEFFSKLKPNPGEPWVFAQGKAFEADFQVVLGAQAARATGLKLGHKISLTHGTGESREGEHVHDEHKYEVVGILAPTGGPHDRAMFTSLQSTWVIHAQDRRERDAAGAHVETTAADLTDADRKVTGVYVRLATRADSDVPANLPQVFDMLRKDPSIVVASPSDEARKLLVIVGNIDIVFRAMAGVVLVSSAISIMIALYNSMEQRRRQIAVLRVLGCSRPRIFGLVLTESAVLGVLGAAAGLVVSLLGARSVVLLMKAKFGLVVHPSLSPDVAIVVAGAAVALAALAGLVPAVMAYATPVAKNLRPLA